MISGSASRSSKTGTDPFLLLSHCVGHSVVSDPRVTSRCDTKSPADAETVADGVLASVLSWQRLLGSVFCSNRRGGLFAVGIVSVVAEPEADQGPSPLAFSARTCTR